MGFYAKIYGLSVFVVTCLLVKSHPNLEHGGQQRREASRVYQALRRPLSAALAAGDDDGNDDQSPAVMWGSLMLTVVVTTVLVLVLALCTCGKKSNKSSSPEPEISPEENVEVTAQPVGNGPSSPVVVTGDSPQQPPQTPSPEVAARGAFTPISPNGGALLNSPPSPNFGDMSDILYADASPTASPSHAPTRGATINRQLPKLPPTVVTDGDEKDQDYDGTYDVIPEKRKRDTPTDDYEKGGGYERLRDAKAKGPLMPPDLKEDPYAKVNERRKTTRKASLEDIADPNYNSIEETRGAVAGSPPKAGVDVDLDLEDLEADGHYACVGGDKGRKKDAHYASVKGREEVDRSNGYCRVREVQNTPTSPDLSGVAIATRISPVSNRRTEHGEEEDDVPPAIPEKLPDLDNVFDGPMSPASQSHQRLPSVGSLGSGSGISIGHMERTSPVPPASPNLSNHSNSQAGLAASIAAGTAAAANDFTDQATNGPPTNGQLKEKPYTQVSARESLEFVRARQQAEHTALTAHYELVNENENDYDGIYETVNEGQMSPQPEPPPLPHNRQAQAQAPAARLAVYEEISESDRHHQPAQAAAVAEVEDDEMQPYASTQTRAPTAANQPASRPAQRSAPTMSAEAVYAQVDKERGGSLKNSDLYTQVKRAPGSSVRAGANGHDARSNVNGAQSPPEPPALSPNQPVDNFEDLYSKVQKQPSLDGMQRPKGPTRQNGMDLIVHSPPEGIGPDSSYQSIDECLNDDDVGNRARAAGLIHTSQIKPASNTPRKPKEHTYQAVDDNKNPKKTKKEKKEKEKKNKKDHQNNRTPSPQPQNNPPVWERREMAPHSQYEDINVNNAPIVNDNANKRSRSRTNSREQVKVNGLANQDTRVRTNSREQIVGNQDTRIRTNSREQIVGNQDTRIRTNSREQVNGTAPPPYTKQGSRSRTNSHEHSGMNGGVLPQDIKQITGPTENGNNNCAHPSDFFLSGFAQETRL